jgi:hypothetical protein
LFVYLFIIFADCRLPFADCPPPALRATPASGGYALRSLFFATFIAASREIRQRGICSYFPPLEGVVPKGPGEDIAHCLLPIAHCPSLPSEIMFVIIIANILYNLSGPVDVVGQFAFFNILSK